MNTLDAFVKGEGARQSGSPVMVFDWNKAAALIKETNPIEARAGLSGDWEYTGGTIWSNGNPALKEETYTYLASNWAFPELDLDGEIIECWVMQDGSGWDSGTYWPDSALEILGKSK